MFTAIWVRSLLMMAQKLNKEEMNMKKYMAPEAEAIVLQSADCLTASLGDYGTQKDYLDFDAEW